jgi:hypothetical protein
MKLKLFVLWLWFKINIFNNIHDFTLCKFIKDMLTLTSYTSLDTPTSNADLLFEIDSINFIK